MAAEDRKLIEDRCRREGLTIREWSVTEDGETAALGRFVVTTDDYEQDGLYPDDEGELTANVVGAPQYGNVRVAFTFTPDDCDSGNDVEDLLALDPVDA